MSFGTDPSVPAWLGDCISADAVTVEAIPNSTRASASSLFTTTMTPENVPKVVYFLRVINITSMILLATSSILSFLSLSSLSSTLISIYILIFSTISCIFDLHFTFLNQFLGCGSILFLERPVWRFGFNILLATMAWTLDSVVGYVSAVVLGICAVANLVIYCKFPQQGNVHANVK